MRFKSAPRGGHQGDMTPMIDMVFQLIAFFMVVVNFAEVDQNERIHLPSSELAKPPDAAVTSPITLQVTKEGTIIVGGEEVGLPGLQTLLRREREIFDLLPSASVKTANIIIRADSDTKIGRVQEVIQICQENGFENYKLRAQQQESHLRDRTGSS